MRLIATLLILLSAKPAHAWNAFGHRVIADIAWQRLAPETQQQIVATLRRHPRFDEDFAKKLPAGVDEDRWIFQQAAVWPDLIRGNKQFDHPTWRYINYPLFVGGERPLLGVNLSTDYPPLEPQDTWNVAQAVKHCIEALGGDGPPGDKAIAYCWLLHLMGDLHQPLHTTAMFSERFPSGDPGGNLIPVSEGGNLHTLWDGLLGTGERPSEVSKVVAQLNELEPSLWHGLHDDPAALSAVEQAVTEFDGKQPICKVDGGEVEGWIRESHELAKVSVCASEIIFAVEEPGELRPVVLPVSYLEQASDQARTRAVLAGIRTANLLQCRPLGFIRWSELPKVIPTEVNFTSIQTSEGKRESVGGWQELSTVQFSIANHDNRSVHISRGEVEIEAAESLRYTGSTKMLTWGNNRTGKLEIPVTRLKEGAKIPFATDMTISPSEVERLTVWLNPDSPLHVVMVKVRFRFFHDRGVVESEPISCELHPPEAGAY